MFASLLVLDVPWSGALVEQSKTVSDEHFAVWMTDIHTGFKIRFLGVCKRRYLDNDQLSSNFYLVFWRCKKSRTRRLVLVCFKLWETAVIIPIEAKKEKEKGFKLDQSRPTMHALSVPHATSPAAASLPDGVACT